MRRFHAVKIEGGPGVLDCRTMKFCSFGQMATAQRMSNDFEYSQSSVDRYGWLEIRLATTADTIMKAMGAE